MDSTWSYELQDRSSILRRDFVLSFLLNQISRSTAFWCHSRSGSSWCNWTAHGASNSKIEVQFFVGTLLLFCLPISLVSFLLHQTYLVWQQFTSHKILGSLVVRIAAFPAEDPSSILGQGICLFGSFFRCWQDIWSLRLCDPFLRPFHSFHHYSYSSRSSAPPRSSRVQYELFNWIPSRADTTTRRCSSPPEGRWL